MAVPDPAHVDFAALAPQASQNYIEKRFVEGAFE
jgi:hypothetical protein